MASVFLSYDRDDGDKARAVALALEKARHSVWWDFHIRGGAQFSVAIEEALKSADAVVVLWSRYSVESPWVRDEAAAGRDTGRLVPVVLDKTAPPLGFRQFQTLDLSGWKGRGRLPCMNELLAAVSASAAQPGSFPPGASPLPPARVERESGRRWPVAAVLVIALIAALGVLASTLVRRSSSIPIVAVGAADQSQGSQILARDLLVKLGSLQAANAHTLELVAREAGGKVPTLFFDVSSLAGPDRADATVALFDGKGRTLLWSKDFEQPSGNLGNLKQQVAYIAAQVLDCALESLATRGRPLDQQTLKLYLTGCAASADKAGGNPQALVGLFRQITQKASDFPGGWAKLLLVESEFARMQYFPGAAGILAMLPSHLAAARRLDPNMAEALVAEAALLPDIAFGRRIELVQRAVDQDPDNAAALGLLSDNLLLVGRMNEAVDRARQAVQANPLAPEARDSLVAALTYAGKMDAALAEVEKAERLWPGATSAATARFRIHLRYGDPKEALRMVKSGVVATDPYVESFLQARIDPSPANIDRAIHEAQTAYNRQPTVIYHLAQVLGAFGREEDLIQILLNWPHPDKVTFVADVLFRPALRNVQRDPRMIPIAKRLGLLDYWTKSGQWPDFCFEPDLPYDCKKVAAKLKA